MSNEEPPATTVRREEPTVATPTPSSEMGTVPETQESLIADLEQASEEVFAEDMVPDT